MICAYDKVYLEKARVSLGRMLDFAVYDLNYDISDFFDMFIFSRVSNLFERGDSSIICGKSGIELAYLVLDSLNINMNKRISPKYTANRSPEYWVGWALTYYQWKTTLSFSEIIKYIPIKNIIMMYSKYHEMDIRQFVDEMNRLYKTSKGNTNLKERRLKAGLTQKQLAELSDIPIRTIQQYEQRKKNINSAKMESVVALSRVLSCRIEDLMEMIDY